MALLELGQRTYSIPVGEVVLGSDAGCAISLTGAGVLPRHALLLSQADGQVVIRKAAPAAEVTINGVRLGSEPTPLLHGDKVEVGDHELTFVDERRSGSTQYVQALPQATGGAGGGGARAKPGATGTTGGRIVSLTDGREYVIAGPSLVFGREAGCDVVVAGKNVSRRHAEIVQTPRGYLLVDSSTNGTFVSETRVEGQRILQRADVIRIGDEQFRFYADVAPASPAPPAPAAPAAPPAPVGPPPGPAASAPQAAPQPPPGASERLRDTMHGFEPAPRPSQARSLASFLVKSGALKGQRLQVKTPVVNVGRADYNDLVISDGSVSTAHATLQRRDGDWVPVALDSRYGTFVDGERVHGESPLAPGAVVRFDDVQLVFEPTDDAVGIAKGGGTQVLRTPHSVPPAAKPTPSKPVPSKPPPAAKAAPAAPAVPAAPARPAPARPGGKPGGKRPQTAPPPEKKGKGCGAGAVILLLGGAGVAGLIHWLVA